MADFKPDPNFVDTSADTGDYATKPYVNSTFVKKAGDTITGDIIDLVATTNPNGLITKDYVDTHSGGGTTYTATAPVNITGSVISLNAIDNNKIASNAAIAFNKMATLTASKNLVSDSSGVITTTNTEYIPTTGGTITGDIIASASTTNPNGLTTKSYVDSKTSSSSGGAFVGDTNPQQAYNRTSGVYDIVHNWTLPAGILANVGDKVIFNHWLIAHVNNFSHYIRIEQGVNGVDMFPVNDTTPPNPKEWFIETKLFRSTTGTLIALQYWVTYGELQTSPTFLFNGSNSQRHEIPFNHALAINLWSNVRALSANLVGILFSSWRYEPASGSNGTFSATTPINLTAGVISLNPLVNANISSTADISLSKLKANQANEMVVSDVNQNLTTVPLLFGTGRIVTNYTNSTISLDPITDADISSVAAIDTNKLKALTANQVVITDANGLLTTTSVTPSGGTTDPLNLYIAGIGNDTTGIGTIVSPYRSIEKAEQTVTGSGSIYLGIGSSYATANISLTKNNVNWQANGNLGNQKVNIVFPITIATPTVRRSFKGISFQTTSSVSITHSSTNGILNCEGCSFTTSNYGIDGGATINATNGTGFNYISYCDFGSSNGIRLQNVTNSNTFNATTTAGSTIISGVSPSFSVGTFISSANMKKGTVILALISAGTYLINYPATASGTVTCTFHVTWYLNFNGGLKLDIGTGHMVLGYGNNNVNITNGGDRYICIDNPEIVESTTFTGLLAYNFTNFIGIGGLASVTNDGNSTGLWQCINVPFSSASSWKKIVSGSGGGGTSYTAGDNISITSNVISTSITTTANYTDPLDDLAIKSNNIIVKKPTPLASQSVISATTATPPATSNIGDTYIVPTGATGTWTLYVDKLAVSDDGVSNWLFSSASTNLSYTTSDTNLTYKWNGTTWSTITPSNYVAKVGDVMTGFLTLNANPTANLHACTKQYVDARSAPFSKITDATLSDPILTCPLGSNPSIPSNANYNKVAWRRDGSMILFEWIFHSTASPVGYAAGSGTYALTLPDSLEFDLTKYATIPSTFSGPNNIGTCNIFYNSPSDSGTGVVYIYDSTKVWMFMHAPAVGWFNWGSGNSYLNVFPLMIKVEFQAYIKTWTIGISPLNSLTLTNSSLLYLRSGIPAITPANGARLNFTIFDAESTVSSWITTGTNWLFTAKFTVNLNIHLQVGQPLSNVNFNTRLYKVTAGGSITALQYLTDTCKGQDSIVVGSACMFLNENESFFITIEGIGVTSMSAVLTVNASPSMQIYQPNPIFIKAGVSAVSIASGVEPIVGLVTLENNLFTQTNGVFTCPLTGPYQISGIFQSRTNNANLIVYLYDVTSGPLQLESVGVGQFNPDWSGCMISMLYKLIQGRNYQFYLYSGGTVCHYFTIGICKYNS